jgi:hypothetical protein
MPTTAGINSNSMGTTTMQQERQQKGKSAKFEAPPIVGNESLQN